MCTHGVGFATPMGMPYVQADTGLEVPMAGLKETQADIAPCPSAGTPYHLHHAVVQDTVRILAVWHTSRLPPTFDDPTAAPD